MKTSTRPHYHGEAPIHEKGKKERQGQRTDSSEYTCISNHTPGAEWRSQTEKSIQFGGVFSQVKPGNLSLKQL